MRLLVLAAVVGLGAAAYVEASGAAESGGQASFTPSVAFKKGFKNQYLDSATGHWVSDSRPYATAFKAKRDILKYCRKAYPKLEITNIVEDSHFHKLGSWCSESDETKCKWTHTVRPFKCVVGEFKSEALLVPSGCRFTHEDQSSACDDFARWEAVAAEKCRASHRMAVRSFALLNPCGLDLYAGVEMVCCPNKTSDSSSAELETPAAASSLLSTRFGDETDEDSRSDDPYYDDDDSDDTSQEEEEESVEEAGQQDPYFRVADPDNEHDNFKAAERRLEKRHRDQVARKTQEWEELSKRYLRMKVEDPKRAESFKAENTEAFQKTIQALQEEFAEARRQLDEVHQERVLAALNERKRAAIKEYRDALASSLDTPQPHKVLKTLEAYVRSEEKDRRHSLNRFKHLLRSADPRVQGFQVQLLRRLKDIDLRINGTIAMLHDMPRLEEKVKPVVLEFWKTFRRENSEDIGDASLAALGGEGLHSRLVAKYRQLYQTVSSAEEPRTTLRVVDPVEERQREVETRFDDIVSHQLSQPEEPSFVAHARQEEHFHSASVAEEGGAESGSHLGLVLGAAGSLLLVGAVLGTLFLRRAGPSYVGVPTGDGSPEQRHLDGMQVAGYENPTYKFFDEVKA